MASFEKRTAADGKSTYRVKVRLKGYPPQTASFERLTDAKKWAASTESAIREGRYFKTAESKRHTLAELIDRYIKEVLPSKPKSKEKQTALLKWWRDHIGSYVLADVIPSLIAEHRDNLAAEITIRGTQRSPASVVRHMAALSVAYTQAVNEWGWLDANPMRKVKKPTEPRGRVRFLDDDERTRLLQACKESTSPYLYAVVVLALSTGMRSAEIMNLTWGTFDMKKGRAILHKTKNNERRAVAITGHAMGVLKELNRQRNIDNKLIFPGKSAPPINLRKPWLEAVKKAQLDDFKFHDLRHSAASYLAMNGASLAEIAEVLGHKTLQMVKRYAHLSEGHTARVVESMNNKIFG